MIEARMTDPDPKQVLRYLGYRGQDMQTGIAWQIQKGIRTVGEIAAPRLVWRRLPVWNGEISGLPAKGQEIRDLLMPCREAVVMGGDSGHAGGTDADAPEGYRYGRRGDPGCLPPARRRRRSVIVLRRIWGAA